MPVPARAESRSPILEAGFSEHWVWKDGQANRMVSVAGDRRTIAQIAGDYAAATGKALHRVRRGSIADGYAELRRMAKAGAHPMAMLPLQYLLPMMSGEGTLRDIANDQYPTVRPTSLLDFMKRHYATKGSKR